MVNRIIFVLKIEHDDKYDHGKRAGEIVIGTRNGESSIVCCPSTKCGQESSISTELLTSTGGRVSMNHYTECPHCKLIFAIIKNVFFVESLKETSESK